MQHTFILHKIRICNMRRMLLFCLIFLILGVLFSKIQGIGIFFYIIAVLGLFLFIGLFLFPMLSPIYRHLSRYGNAKELLSDAEEELYSESILQGHGLFLTPKYLIVIRPLSVSIIPLVSVLWVFPLNNMRFSFSAKREIMYYHLRIVTITGDLFKIQNRRKKEIDSILRILIDRYPNFFYDYSEEHADMVRYILTENKKEIRENRKKMRRNNTTES